MEIGNRLWCHSSSILSIRSIRCIFEWKTIAVTITQRFIVLLFYGAGAFDGPFYWREMLLQFNQVALKGVAWYLIATFIDFLFPYYFMTYVLFILNWLELIYYSFSYSFIRLYRYLGLYQWNPFNVCYGVF